MTTPNDIQYVRWDPTSGGTTRNEFSMLTPRSGAEAMARLAAQAQEEQRMHEQGRLPARPINETTNNRPQSAATVKRNNEKNNNTNNYSPAATNKSNNNNIGSAATKSPAVNNNSRSLPSNNNNNNYRQDEQQQPHHYNLNLDSQQRTHPVTPVQVLLQVQESLEHAVATANQH